MIKLKKNSLILLISIMVIGMNHVALSKNDYCADCMVNSEIAKVVLCVEKDNIINGKIEETSFPMEYNFSIHNYKEDIVNEVTFDYIIEIENSVDNFPVSYVLIDCDNHEEIKLVDGKSQPMQIAKNTKQSRKFKLYLQWRELDCNLADQIQINLKINAVQCKEG